MSFMAQALVGRFRRRWLKRALCLLPEAINGDQPVDIGASTHMMRSPPRAVNRWCSTQANTACSGREIETGG
jgi:hypothetical protein